MTRKSKRTILVTVGFVLIFVASLVVIGNSVLFAILFTTLRPGLSEEDVSFRLFLWKPTSEIAIGDEWTIWYYDSSPRYRFGSETELVRVARPSELVEPYEKYGILFDSNFVARAFVLTGESLYVQSDLGDLPGSGLSVYLDKWGQETPLRDTP